MRQVDGATNLPIPACVAQGSRGGNCRRMSTLFAEARGESKGN
jgi:hypothetical protein